MDGRSPDRTNASRRCRHYDGQGSSPLPEAISASPRPRLQPSNEFVVVRYDLQPHLEQNVLHGVIAGAARSVAAAVDRVVRHLLPGDSAMVERPERFAGDPFIAVVVVLFVCMVHCARQCGAAREDVAALRGRSSDLGGVFDVGIGTKGWIAFRVGRKRFQVF